MHIRKATILVHAVLLSAALVSLAPATIAQGSQGDMFRRHFWRGQVYHGPGYPAQVGEVMGGTVPTGASSGPATFEAIVQDGTPGAAIARDAAACAARFKSYDPSSGFYRGRGGRRLPCP